MCIMRAAMIPSTKLKATRPITSRCRLSPRSPRQLVDLSTEALLSASEWQKRCLTRGAVTSGLCPKPLKAGSMTLRPLVADQRSDFKRREQATSPFRYNDPRPLASPRDRQLMETVSRRQVDRERRGAPQASETMLN